jgi:hypothetical protein
VWKGDGGRNGLGGDKTGKMKVIRKERCRIVWVIRYVRANEKGRS